MAPSGRMTRSMTSLAEARLIPQGSVATRSWRTRRSTKGLPLPWKSEACAVSHRRPDDINYGTRGRPVAHQISEEGIPICPQAACVVNAGRQSLEVCVNVCQQRCQHGVDSTQRRIPSQAGFSSAEKLQVGLKPRNAVCSVGNGALSNGLVGSRS